MDSKFPASAYLMTAKPLMAAALGAALLTACSTASTLPFGLSKSSNQVAAGTSLDPSPKATATPITFPQASCGDPSTTDSQTWYPVFINGGDVTQIRSKYCGNAVSTVREKTGAATVQVASFTDRDRAIAFATAVGGEVESPVVSAAEAEAAPRAGQLIAADPGSPINVRESADLTSAVQDVGYAGDRVQIQSKTRAADGFTWYRIQFESGTTGWVRGDLISSSGEGSTRTASAAIASPTASPVSTASSTATSSPSSETSAGSATSSTASSTSSASPTSSMMAVITAQDQGSPINIRQEASTTADVQDVAYAGDAVRISERTQGSDGQTWYKVEFESGRSGWVRGDFVKSN